MSDNQKTWFQVVEEIKPYIVKLITRDGSGTGFLFAYSDSGKVCGIATAAHVINHANYWQESIRIQHFSSHETILIKEDERAIFLDANKDAASIVIHSSKLPFPKKLLALVPEGKYVKIGNEIGWMGFPAISPNDCCFFSGRLSCWINEQDSYLVDGVAINGVSGGPAFYHNSSEGITEILGVVSAYIPNRATGVSLPGLCVIRDVTPFHEAIARLKSLTAAKEEAPTPQPPLQPEPPPKQSQEPPAQSPTPSPQT